MRFKKKNIFLSERAITYEMTLDEEPLIYSVKYSLGNRFHPLQFFTRKKWRSFLKCHFLNYYNTKTPVVVFVKFYVSPPTGVEVSEKDLVAERTAAVQANEICDYLLAFLDMLRSTLFASYRQIAKIHAEKYYSKQPRTQFQFMSWLNYVKLFNYNPNNSGSERECKKGEKRILQPKRQVYDVNKGNSRREPCADREETTHGPSSSDSVLYPSGS